MIFNNRTANNCKHYLYKYIRLDTNQPFYFGIGTRYKSKTDFRRAKQAHNHNSICAAIIKKTDYKIEIIEESDDYNFIKQREIYYISLYGRKQNNTGILANMTDGGQGMLGTKSPKSKIIYAYNKEGYFVREFENGHIAGQILNVSPTCVCEAARKFNTYLIKSLQLSYIKYDKLPARMNNAEKVSQRFSKIRIQMDLNGNIIREWPSANVAAIALHVTRSSIIECCNGKRRTSGGYKWKLKENN